MNTSMELVYGLLLLIFILGLTELLAFAIALIRSEYAAPAASSAVSEDEA